MQQTTIKTPNEIWIHRSVVQDHGLVLLHDLAGAKRNWHHEVSMPAGEHGAEAHLRALGYGLRHGWRKDGQQLWCYTRTYPLEVVAQ